VKADSEKSAREPKARRKVRSRYWPFVRVRHDPGLSFVQPAAIEAYFDKVQVWLLEPLSNGELGALRAECDGKVHLKKKRARFRRWGAEYEHFLVLRQPSRKALEVLAGRKGLIINSLECALDWTFAEEEQKEIAANIVSQLHFKKYHRGQGVRFVGATRYSGPRGAPTIFVLYDDMRNRHTGAQECVHLEWRMVGLNAVRAAGVRSISDLLNFDHRSFWKERLLLFGVDLRKLGRSYHNHHLQTKRRAAWISHHGSFSYDHDLRAGATLVRAFALTQNLVDELSKRFSVKHALIAVECTHLLPPPPAY
jgi:hypothetical protein